MKNGVLEYWEIGILGDEKICLGLEYWGVKKFVYDLLSPCRIVGNFFQFFPETTPPSSPSSLSHPLPLLFTFHKNDRGKKVLSVSLYKLHFFYKKGLTFQGFSGIMVSVEGRKPNTPKPQRARVDP